MKDWKKTTKGWKNKQNSNFLGIFYQKEIEKPYVVVVIAIQPIKEKRFKTKQQALKYARNYMRKH